MTPRLLSEFFDLDCDATVRQILLAEIRTHGTEKTDVVREFNFNQFNIYLDFQNRQVKVEDELDVSEQGSCFVSLAEFAAALNDHKPLR